MFLHTCAYWLIVVLHPHDNHPCAPGNNAACGCCEEVFGCRIAMFSSNIEVGLVDRPTD